MRKYHIEPSRDFVERTILKIAELDSQKKLIANVFKIALIFTPFIVREVWLLIRHDFFSVSALPFNNMIVSAYGFFISGMAFYLLLSAGVIGCALCLTNSRKFFRLRFIAQLFNQARFRI